MAWEGIEAQLRGEGTIADVAVDGPREEGGRVVVASEEGRMGR